MKKYFFPIEINGCERLIRIIFFWETRPPRAFAFFIFSFFNSRHFDPVTRNHERIHFWQQLECLFVFHWLIYLWYHWYCWAYDRKGHDTIPFELECEANETDMEYMERRPWFAWTRYKAKQKIRL